MSTRPVSAICNNTRGYFYQHIESAHSVQQHASCSYHADIIIWQDLKKIYDASNVFDSVTPTLSSIESVIVWIAAALKRIHTLWMVPSLFIHCCLLSTSLRSPGAQDSETSDSDRKDLHCRSSCCCNAVETNSASVQGGIRCNSKTVLDHTNCMPRISVEVKP